MIDKIGAKFHWYFKCKAEEIVPLKGDASARQIYRVKYGDNSVIAVYGPNPAENRAFLGFTRSFYENKFPVPQILYSDESSGIYFLQDLGDETIFSFITRYRKTGFSLLERIGLLYEIALEWLVCLQTEGAQILDFDLCYQTRVFDYPAWKIDHDYFLRCFIDIFAGKSLPRLALENDLEIHRQMLLPFTGDLFMYRDFQSRNIMLWQGKSYFLDYQSGRIGHPCYDLASLLYDARADLPDDFREELKERYIDRISIEAKISADELREAFPLYALLRILQALGSYGNNGVKKGKTEYLESIPYALKNALGLFDTYPVLQKLTVLKEVLTEMRNSKF